MGGLFGGVVCAVTRIPAIPLKQHLEASSSQDAKQNIMRLFPSRKLYIGVSSPIMNGSGSVGSGHPSPEVALVV
jgi:hypothetical protein